MSTIAAAAAAAALSLSRPRHSVVELAELTGDTERGRTINAMLHVLLTFWYAFCTPAESTRWFAMVVIPQLGKHLFAKHGINIDRN